MKRKNSPMPVCMWRWCECVCVFAKKSSKWHCLTVSLLQFHKSNERKEDDTEYIAFCSSTLREKSLWISLKTRLSPYHIGFFPWEIRFLCLVLSLNVGRACSIASTWVRDQKWNDAICNITVTKVAFLFVVYALCFSVKKVTVIKRWQNHRWLRVFYMLYEKCLLFKMFWWPQHHRPQR